MQRPERICLLNPGPVTLSPRVRQALHCDDLCHREPEFAALQADVRGRLARVYPEAERDYTAVLLTGSGTAAVEAMVGSLVPRGGKALVAANGVYGERVALILQAQGKAHDTVAAAWTEPIDLDGVGRKLRECGPYSHVIAVHHETTTGRLNDITALAAVCRTHGPALLLDTVSSFGGEPIDFEGWNVEACAATANKCLHGVPGESFVLARKQALEARTSGACSVYLDLYRNHVEQCHGYPLFTPAVQVLYALQEALRELDESGGWPQRHLHYRSLSSQLRAGLRERGIRPLLRDEEYSATLASFALPEGLSFNDLYPPLKEFGFVIYPGQQTLLKRIFRVAVMGDLRMEDVSRFLEAFTIVRARQKAADTCPGEGRRR